MWEVEDQRLGDLIWKIVTISAQILRNLSDPEAWPALLWRLIFSEMKPEVVCNSVGTADGTLITMMQCCSLCWSAPKSGRAARQTRLCVLYPHAFRLLGAPAWLGSPIPSGWWSETEFAGSISVSGRNLWLLRTSLSNGELMVLL